MTIKIYFNLLLISGLWSQGVIGIFSENNIKSSDLHVRRKRIIDPMAHENMFLYQHIPYIVNILINGTPYCAGSILLTHIILTAAHCMDNDILMYTILSGSQFANNGVLHNITEKIIHPNNVENAYSNDIGLFIIHPPIDIYNSFNDIISVATFPVPPSTFGTVSGWGISGITPNGREYPNQLRSISVPTIRQADCIQMYNEEFNINDNEFCTFDTFGKRCSFGDSGAPFAINRLLVGVYSWSGDDEGRPNPDVFMNVTDPEFRNWIMSYIIPHPRNPYNQPHLHHPLNSPHLHNPYNLAHTHNPPYPQHPYNSAHTHNPPNPHHPYNSRDPYNHHN